MHADLLNATRPIHTHIARGLAALFLVALLGCGGSVEYFDEMEMMPVKERLLEFPLGHHVVPIPVELPAEGIEWTHGNAICLTFDLFAVVQPSHEKYLIKEWERQEGNFRNDVIEVCRQSTLDELASEPDLTTLRSRLTELTTRRLGKDRVRRLVLSEISLQPL